MKKIFGGSRRSRTPGAPGGGDAGAANANGMLQASNAAHHGAYPPEEVFEDAL